MESFDIATLKDWATIANLILIPIAIFLAKINTKIEVFNKWMDDHTKSDERIHSEVYDRLREVELKQAAVNTAQHG